MTVEIVVNGEPVVLEDGASVSALAERLSLGPRGIALAVNDTVVDRENWASQELKDKDEVIIITATQGG